MIDKIEDRGTTIMGKRIALRVGRRCKPLGLGRLLSHTNARSMYQCRWGRLGGDKLNLIQIFPNSIHQITKLEGEMIQLMEILIFVRDTRFQTDLEPTSRPDKRNSEVDETRHEVLVIHNVGYTHYMQYTYQ